MALKVLADIAGHRPKLKMLIFVYVHMWPPIHNAGSEVTVHAATREMVKRGHDVVTIADKTPDSYQYEGVTVLSVPKNQFQHAKIREYAKDADILITHLDCTSLAMGLSIDLHRPLVHFVHNHAQLGYWNTPPHKAQLIVFNSHWIAKNETYKGEPWPGESIVLHPVIEPDKYKCERGTKITFCNPTEGKGVETVHKLAESMPDYEFLIVEGIYGEQVAPPNLNAEWELAHPNIEHMKNSPDFRDVLRKTKVLLMPSNYESYGRCAAEAACAGIPSIVSPTQGLWECLSDGSPYPALQANYGIQGSSVIANEVLPAELFNGGLVNGAGIFCVRKDVASWKAQIERLYSDDIYYRSRSDAALKLAKSFDPESDFDRLEAALLKTVSDWKKAQEVQTVAMWTADRRLWETTDGKLVAEIDGRIPRDAVKLAAGIGTEIPEEVARANGLLPLKNEPVEQPEEKSTLLNSKSLSPDEDKAIHAPAEDKAQKVKRKKRVA